MHPSVKHMFENFNSKTIVDQVRVKHAESDLPIVVGNENGDIFNLYIDNKVELVKKGIVNHDIICVKSPNH